MARTDKQGGGKSWIFWGAGLLVVILVVVVGLLTIPTGSNEAEEPDEGLNAEGPDPSAQPVEPEEEPTEGDAPDRCEDMDADSAFPTEAPAFEWQDFDGIENFAVPVSDEHGPVVQEDGFWRCFSQTPAGAAFAAFNLEASFFLGGNLSAAQDSPGARAAFPDDVDRERQEAEALLRGFRIVSSDDASASVDLWVGVPDGSGDLRYSVDLVWDESANDWRLDLAGGMPPISELESTQDFTEWR